MYGRRRSKIGTDFVACFTQNARTHLTQAETNPPQTPVVRGHQIAGDAA
jgi:hypothetical protein